MKLIIQVSGLGQGRVQEGKEEKEKVRKRRTRVSERPLRMLSRGNEIF